MPPQEPRIEFVGTYTTDFDLLPRTTNRAWLKFLGLSPTRIFSRPFGVAIINDDKSVAVSDLERGSISLFNFTPTIRREHLPFKIDRPHGLTMDSKGNLYVIDGTRKKVLVYSDKYRLLKSFGNNQLFGNPSFITVNEDVGKIYVSDGVKHRVAVFDLNGEFLFFIGEPGASAGQFASPQGLKFDQENRLFVADMLNARIQVLDSEGNFLYSFGQQCDQVFCFENPKDLAITSDGTLFIVDYRKGLLLAYSSAGEFLFQTGGGSRTSHPLGFSMPAAIAIDSSDRIFITDFFNRRLSVWQYLSEDYLDMNPLSGFDRIQIEEFSQKSRILEN